MSAQSSKVKKKSYTSPDISTTGVKIKTRKYVNAKGETIIYAYPADRYKKPKVSNKELIVDNSLNKSIKQRKGYKIIGKGGKVNTKYQERTDAILDKLKEEDIVEYNRAKAILENAKRKGEDMTDKKLLSKLTTNRYEKMFVNAGYTLEEAAEELGVTPDQLIDPNNWDKNNFKATNKYGYEVEYTYHIQYRGSVWAPTNN